MTGLAQSQPQVPPLQGQAAGAFEVKGWCPGALRPMLSGDGMLARLRLPMGQMSPEQALGLARAAASHGNGQMQLSGRGNLQLRGITQDSHGDLLQDLAGLGVLDADPVLEGRRNILISPFFAEGDGSRDLAQELTARLIELPALPSKFGHVIDIGPQRRLAQVPGDLRLERGQGGALILRADGAGLGQKVTRRTAVSALIALAQWFVAAGGVTEGRGRMRDLIARGALPPGARLKPAPAAPAPGPGPSDAGLLVGFEFGSLAAATLSALAGLGHPIRLTPWRMVLLVGLQDKGAVEGLPGVICDAADPLLAVRACPGAPLCPQAHAPTAALGRALAPRVPKGQILHVSGCAKGCAHPAAADLVLVAGPEGFTAARRARADQASGKVRSAAELLADPRLFDQSGAHDGA